ncbi:MULTISPECIES: ATP-binding protein [Xanthomonas]|uniref:histidine kinase n=1 Tax=Xanthomonas sacchari TaxID=56458 RepID=A0AA46Y7E9_9XANT|nr:MULTISPECIES: ATP-binding protein [Xanthomonas]KAB7781490.1 PAS domain-containing sensor histidine kinase [Xanthomonas sp. LMG 12460]MCW0367431.1 Adaptive-response sensory-kinase SasA [Xanthomonas sacchari]MCW0441568.1 Adaptive-response sensory-kinase SasA [Xanthomonas sacchari]MCW0464340.1 Adaptive-response sensory-kinase SasA [Xanthomonas sacchari]MDY4284837.1 PAS domain S-box protein [Xanthomonas sp. LF06-19]
MTTHAHYRQIVELSHDCIKEVGRDGVVRSINPHGLALLGVSDPADVVGHNWVELWPEDMRSLTQGAFAAALGNEQREFWAERPSLDGRRRWWHVMVSPLANASARVESVLVISRDVTQQHQVEQALRALGHLAPIEGRGDTMDADDAAALGRRWQTEQSQLRGQLDIALAAQRVAERAMTQAQKGEAVGQMLAGVVHDFNNMLHTAITSVSMVADHPQRLQPDQQRLLAIANEALQHGAGMTRRLLGFARAHPVKPIWLDLNALVTQMQPLLAQALGGEMRLQLLACAEVATTYADRNAVEQAVLNLALNARDASRPGDAVTIRCGALEVPPSRAAAMRQPGRYVTLAVSDQGEGMSDAVKSRLFEAYFTTKPEGKGTGLGLAQVYGLVRQAGGFVDVESELGRGTTITLAFPFVARPLGDEGEGADPMPVPTAE